MSSARGIDSVIELLTRLAAGDYEARGARIDGDDDLDAVVIGINMLAEELSAHRAELEQRVQARTAELEAARQEAIEASRLKSEFLATMSHEIRTPMNGVIGLTRLLHHTNLDDTQLQYVAELQNAGDSLLNVISDILDFSKLEAGMVELELVEFEPRRLLERITGLVSLPASRKELELLALCDPEVPRRLMGDEGRLRQVLLNLASNAVKFTEKGTVSITARVSNRPGPDRVQLRFEVADTGIGIPDGARSALFDAFTQADASTTRQYGGSGLGLAISRRLTEAMGGTIGVDSVAAVGSTFWFELPFSLPDGPAPAPRLGKASGAHAETPSPAAESSRGRVLVVEDNIVNQLVAEGFVSHLGFDVDTVGNGVEALDAVAATYYSVVLMDCHMPVMDGYAATSEIRLGETGGGRVPIIAMTASATPETRERCLAAGMDDFVPKPVDPETLSDALDRWARPPQDTPPSP